MQKVALTGTKNGVNTIFTLSGSAGVMLIAWAGRLLKEVLVAPSLYEFVRLAPGTVQLGTAPQANDMLFGLVQTNATLSLEEVTITGLQNGNNTGFLLGKAAPAGSNVLIFKNGTILEQVVGGQTSIQFVNIDYNVAFGAAPLATDQLRAFVAAPGTYRSGPGSALMSVLPITGSQDGLNTRYTVSQYNPQPGLEPLFLLIIDGILQSRVFSNPQPNQYLLVTPLQFALGFAPTSVTSMQAVLVGNTPLTVSPYTFTARKMAQKLQIWLQRRLNEPEAEEVVAQTYREYIDTTQWTFLQTHGSFITQGPKHDGVVTLTQNSRIVQGGNTAFALSDIGSFFRLSSYNQAYRITNVDPVTQRLELAAPFANPTVVNQPYVIIKTVYTLGPEIEYVFSMASRWPLREIPYSGLNLSDPTRTAVADVPYYYAYLGKTADGCCQLEVYPVPSQPALVTYVGIRRDIADDPSTVLRGLEALMLNAAAAAGCRMLSLKTGAPDGQMLSQLMNAYETKAAAILDRLDSLDWTRSDIPMVQRMRSNLSPAYDGQYQSTHDTWLLGDW